MLATRRARRWEYPAQNEACNRVAFSLTGFLTATALRVADANVIPRVDEDAVRVVANAADRCGVRVRLATVRLVLDAAAIDTLRLRGQLATVNVHQLVLARARALDTLAQTRGLA